jgi:hypothetical protein
MKDDREEISSVFKKAEWEEVPLSHDMERAGLNGIFISGYAAVGVVIASSASDVVTCWIDCQLQMSDLRENQAVGKNRDLYLIFIVSDIDVSALSDLQTIVNDSHVCRKICIERNGRTLEETLMDTPFLKLVDHDDKIDSQVPNVVMELSKKHGMSNLLLNDLSTRSAGAILERLLSGAYKNEGESDED